MSMSTTESIPEMRCSFTKDVTRHLVHAAVPTATLRALRAQADAHKMSLENYIGITLIAHANTMAMDLMFPHPTQGGDVASTART